MSEVTIPEAIKIALAHHGAGRLPEAEAIYRQILAIDPNHPEALHWLGAIAGATGHIDDALRLIERALQINPNDALSRMDLAEIYRDQNRIDDAIAQYKTAIDLQSASPETRGALFAPYNDLGIVYRTARRYDEALECFRKSLELNYSPHALGNIGNVLTDLLRLDESLDYFDQSLRLRPGHTITVLGKARALLLKGDLKAGLELYEHRLASPELPYPRFNKPLWAGDDPRGKTVLVVAEQGVGDTIQFLRYIPLLAERGPRIKLFIQSELGELVKSLAGSPEIHLSGSAAPEFDVHVPLLSLAHRLGTTLETIPAQVPYLSPPASRLEHWRQRLAPHADEFKVGLVWAGSATHKSDKRRSLSLQSLAPLVAAGDITFFSLQKGPPASQAATPPPGMRLIDLGPELNDYSDTAAVLSHLDLLISVDTSVVHVAGALARPVWTLVAYEPDWRWMLHRQDTPWYPTMKLFRQPSPGDWDSVIHQVTDLLRQQRASPTVG